MNTHLNPHFYIVKLGFAGVYLIFLFFIQNIHCGYSLEHVPTMYVLRKNAKNINFFAGEIFSFYGEKLKIISVYCMGIFS